MHYIQASLNTNSRRIKIISPLFPNISRMNSITSEVGILSVGVLVYKVWCFDLDLQLHNMLFHSILLNSYSIEYFRASCFLKIIDYKYCNIIG